VSCTQVLTYVEQVESYGYSIATQMNQMHLQDITYVASIDILSLCEIPVNKLCQ